ncbi:SH3 domain-containing protein [Marimonas arenosa]|uniref:SH3 domain-containing protein n=2 Tax=Marimonas arenosa TaxID=1795305 RepID=A0AAE3WCD9_9RHOB|nr:SH3 domain-containing protein [Marimonas arenosa]
MRTLALLLLLLPGLARAQEFPALFDVTGVASNDVLNVRAEPNASAEKIGALAFDATDVEVIRRAGGWGLVNSGERSGWVSMRFLAAQQGGDYALSRLLTCFGTEPFWNLEITQGDLARFSAPNQGVAHYTVGLLQRSVNRTDRFVLLGGRLVAVISRTSCNDGMSDRNYGLAIDLLPDVETGAALYSGCCSLTGN